MSDEFEPLTPLEGAALGYCAPRGIPLSVFLGRVVYPGDPQWLPRDTWAAMEWHFDDRARCPGCRNLKDECMAVDAPEYRVTAKRCKACEASDATMREFQEDGGSTSGMYFSVERVVDGNVS